MALTLPVEEMSRLQVSFKLLLPDGRLTFEMSSVGPSPQFPPILNGLKLHFQGFHDHTGLSLKVWASGIEEPDAPSLVGEPTEQTISAAVQAPPPIPPPSPTNVTPLEDSAHPSPSSSTTSSEQITTPEFPLPIPAAQEAQISQAFCDEYDTEADMFHWQPQGSAAISTNYYLDAFDMSNLNWPPFQSDPGFQGDFEMDSTLTHGTPHLHQPETQAIEPPKAERSNPSAQLQQQQHEAPSLDHAHPFPHYHIMTCKPETPPSHSEVGTPAAASVVHIDDSEPSTSHAEFSLMVSDISTPSSTRSSPGVDSSRPYRCLFPDCDRWFKRDYTRKVHMLTHTRNKDRKPFGCSVTGCPERFSRKHDRLRHEVGRHGLGSEWRCDPCNRFFSSKTTLERHVLDKHGENTFQR